MMKGKQLSTPSAEKKAAGERKIFQCFLLDLGWSPGEVSSEDPPAPDILYKPLDGVPVAFELAEIADEQLASLISKPNSGEITRVMRLAGQTCTLHFQIQDRSLFLS